MKTLFLLFMVLISYFSYGQNFPGESVDLLLDKTVKPKELESYNQQNGYRNFYSKFDTVSMVLQKYELGSHAFSNGALASDYSELFGKEFKVVNIYSQKSSTGRDEGRYSVLVLNNSELGTIFYDYDSQFELGYELEVVGGLDFPEGYYCKDIEVTTDKFTGVIRAHSESSEGFSFVKVTENGTSVVYLSVSELGATVNVGKKGLILLLENGNKIERPDAEIDVDVKGSNFVYSAFIQLTNEEIDLIINNPITDNRLYIYDGEVKDGEKLSEYLKCMMK